MMMVTPQAAERILSLRETQKRRNADE